MRQKTFADEGFEKHHKVTRREKFLDEMDQIIPWAKLSGLRSNRFIQSPRA